MILDLICSICGEHVIGEAKERITHIKTFHKNELKHMKSSVSLFKIPPIEGSLKGRHKRDLNKRNSHHNKKIISKSNNQKKKLSHKSLYWGSVIKTAFETNRKKH